MRLKLNLQTKIILLVCGVVAGCLLATSLLLSQKIDSHIQAGVGRQALSIAHLVATEPIVIEGLAGRGDEGLIQDYAERSREAAGVEYIVVFDMAGIRKSHPVPERLGKHVIGNDEQSVLAGREYTSIAQGTLGYAMRAFTPVFDTDGKQVGAVLVGVLLTNVQAAIWEEQFILVAVTLGGIMAGVFGSLLLARNIKNILVGLEPEEISKRLEERSAMLQSVREGIIAVDQQGIITLVNDEARKMLQFAGEPADPVGKAVNEAIPHTRLLEVIASGQMELNQEQDFFGISILTNRVPLVVDGVTVGAIATFRDKTEIKRLAEELTGAKLYVEALRSQSHEFMNRLHVILGLVRLECYDQLAAFINQIAADHETEVSYVGQRIRDKVLAGFIISKLSLARENNTTMRLSADSYLPELPGDTLAHDLVTILGNLIENAFDAVKDAEVKTIGVYIGFAAEEQQLTITVEDSGAGIPAELEGRIFERGVSTKAADRGIGLDLVKRTIDRLQGTIEVKKAEPTGAKFIVMIPCEGKGEAHD